MLKPQKIDDVFLAFPADVSHLLPEAPPDYPDKAKWERMAQEIFMGTPSKTTLIEPREGIDTETAARHIRACLGSFQPKHEDKISGVGYLLSLWFTTSESQE